MAIHVVLVEPEIPPNTGNIARSCAATGTVLHLVKPLGFSIDDKSLKRAGLDYWPFVKLQVHESLDEFMAEYGGGDRRMFLATTKGGHIYTDVEFRDEDMILFGRETGRAAAAFYSGTQRERDQDTDEQGYETQVAEPCELR